jgi:hypothetical protein
MKTAISYLKSLMSFLSLSDGAKEQSSTSAPWPGALSCEKYEKSVLKKLAFLAEENRRLKEEIRIRDLQDNLNHDV